MTEAAWLQLMREATFCLVLAACGGWANFLCEYYVPAPVYPSPAIEYWYSYETELV